MNDTDLAWLAGILEGEGCFGAYYRTSGAVRSARARKTLLLRVKMSDRDVIERAAALLGGTVRKAHEPSRKRAGGQVLWITDLKSARAEAAMKAVYPLMGLRRSAKINELLALDLSHRPKARAA